ncbi:MAG: type II toxin-antitoxin system Phd/YefM family antitoxin [Actinomycetota bacterium]
MKVNMHDAKTNLSKLVAALESGEASEIQIARSGRTVARLVPPESKARRKSGRLAGKIHMAASFDDPLPPEIAEVFGALPR